MKRKNFRGISFWFLVAFTGLAHYWVAFSQLPPQLIKGDEGNYFAQTISEHPEIFQKLLLEFLPLLLPYCLFFWLVAFLSRPRGEATHWSDQPTVSLLLTWASLSWVALRTHALFFPNSIWAWLLLSVTTRSTVYFLDLISVAWTAWRLVMLFKYRASPSFRPSVFGTPALLIISMAVLVLAVVNYLGKAGVPEAKQSPGSDSRPNVVVIGIDALRRDVILTVPPNELPNIAGFRDEAFVQSNVVTPLARTFVAWSSILTGKSPRENGVRENHAPREAARLESSFARRMADEGYRTVYATDETRFSNIGADYGFQQVIGPPPGAVDFLLGQFADMPLSNMAIQLPFMEYLTPTLTANRAFAHAYRPERFVSRIRQELGQATSQPTLLAMHLCIPHHPFFTAAPKGDGSLDDAYFHSLRAVDMQLGQVQAMLQELGYINDKTLVVLLSDHGEGLGLDLAHPATITQHQTSLTTAPPTRGHGGSLLENAQWEVFAMFKGASSKGPILPGRSDQLLSLQDIAPTVLELAGMEATSEFPAAVTQGKGGLINDAPSRPYVAMETGFRVRGFNLEAPEAGAAVDIAKSVYNILPNGRLELKLGAYEKAIREKDLGVTTGDKLLTLLWGDDEEVLIEIDYAQNTWDVYPMDPSQTESSPSLLKEACSDDEFRARIESWCSQAKTGAGAGTTQVVNSVN